MATFAQLRKFQIVPMKCLGLLPYKNCKVLQHLLFLANVGSLATFVVYLTQKYQKLVEFEKKIAGIGIIAGTFYTLIKLVIIRGDVGRIQKLYRDIDGMSFDEDSMQEFMLRGKALKKTKFILGMLSLLYGSVSVVLALQPLALRAFMLPSDNWFSTRDSCDLLAWMLLYTYEFFCIFVITSTWKLVDTFAYLPLITIHGLLETLGSQIANLPTDPKGAWNIALTACIKKYLKIKRVCQDFEGIFSKIYLLHMAFMCLLVCSCVATLSYMPTGTYAIDTVCISTITFQIYAPCYLGDLVLEGSEKLQFDLYSSNWQNVRSNESKKGLFIFMEVLKRPIVVSFGKIYILNLRTFTEVVKIVYQMCTLARSFIDIGNLKINNN